jgi:oligoribonuclease NrnB/cAMP/cGMP phosphodiesterase (DHH superfamily)
LIQQYEKKIIKDIASSAITVSFEGYNVLSANCPILRSEIGHTLVDKKGPFSIIWREKGGQVVVSLRANGKVNVAKIAEKYGGGGHPSASGFTLKRGVELPWTSLRSGMDI